MSSPKERIETDVPQLPLLNRNRSSSSLHATNANSSATDRDTSSIDEQQHQAHHPSRTHKPKQFVVGGSRHHSRVPSYGRNLNKLGKLVPLATSPGKTARATASEVAADSQITAGEETRSKSSGKKTTFELGDDGSYKDGSPCTSSGNGSGNGAVGSTIGVTAGPATTTSNPVTKSTTGLAKSSSTRSLDRQSREVARRSISKRTAVEVKRDRSRSKSREASLAQPHTQKSSEALTDIAENQYSLPQGDVLKKQQQQLPQRQVQHHLNHNHLIPQVSQAAINVLSVPPYNSIEVVTTNMMQNSSPNSTHYPPVTPAHSLPGSHDQPLTSRFIESPANAFNSISPSSGAMSYSHPAPQRNKSASSLPAVAASQEQQQFAAPSVTPPTSNTTTIPSRTQQKLWLQRASSQHESPPLNGVVAGSRFGPGSEWYIFQARAQREFERISREYMNIRRFNNPIGEGIERIRSVQNSRRIPRRNGTPNENGAGTLGLSQSLKETGSRGARETRIASKDDSGVKQSGIAERDRESEVDGILNRMWSAGEMLPSNE
ncbi:hypothetical protein RUND412_011454 [Rhizina undulata]